MRRISERLEAIENDRGMSDDEAGNFVDQTEIDKARLKIYSLKNKMKTKRWGYQNQTTTSLFIWNDNNSKFTIVYICRHVTILLKYKFL